MGVQLCGTHWQCLILVYIGSITIMYDVVLCQHFVLEDECVVSGYLQPPFIPIENHTFYQNSTILFWEVFGIIKTLQFHFLPTFWVVSLGIIRSNTVRCYT